MNSFVFILLLATTVAEAKPLRSGASAKPTLSCIETAIGGRFDGDCANDHEADACVGMQLALRNALRKDQCRARAGEGCLAYAYRQNTQSQWVSVAAGYLAVFHQCVRNHYGSNDSSGAQEALDDPNFRALLASLEEGASSFGLREGSILRRTLEGESFESVLSSSPMWTQIPAHEQDTMELAAKTPYPVVDTAADAQAETARLGGRGISAGKHTRRWGAPDSGYGAIIIGSTADRGPASGAGAEVSPRPASNGNFVRALKHNPYSLGLDLTLFDRVSTVYQRHVPNLRGMEDYIKRLPRKSEPKDVRELVNRGGTEL